MNDLDNKTALYFQAAKSGTIDRIGYHCVTRTGTPPAFKIGIYPVLVTTGVIDLTSPLSEQSLTITATGIAWVTLTTTVTVTEGVVYAAAISPGATIPDAANSVQIIASCPALTLTRYPRATYWTTSWTGVDVYGLGVLYSDGTVAAPLAVSSSANYTTIGLNTTPDEIGIKFQLPFTATCVGIGINYYQQADMRLKLYSGATELISYLIDISNHGGTVGGITVEARVAPIILTADTDYRLTLAGEVSGTSRYPFIQTDATSMPWFPGSDRYTNTQRVNGGTWDDTNLYKVSGLYLLLSDITLPAASGSGGVKKWASMG